MFGNVLAMVWQCRVNFPSARQCLGIEMFKVLLIGCAAPCAKGAFSDLRLSDSGFVRVSDDRREFSDLRLSDNGVARVSDDRREFSDLRLSDSGVVGVSDVRREFSDLRLSDSGGCRVIFPQPDSVSVSKCVRFC